MVWVVLLELGGTIPLVQGVLGGGSGTWAEWVFLLGPVGIIPLGKGSGWGRMGTRA